ncbi:hypothetical protein PRIPAC_83896, partial [Pristionchus pacificus]
LCKMPSNALLKRDWQKKHVYLVQYPRCRTLPNLSPWSLKLETWLRMADIPFTNISNEFKKFSSKGQVPFIELNGRQIADSNIIIEALKQEFHKASMEPSAPSDQALAQAFTALVEDHLCWALFALRSKVGFEFLVSDDGFGRHYGTGMKKRMMTIVVRKLVNKNMKTRAQAQGMGKHSPDELHEIAIKDLKSISIFLADKPYFGGDHPTTLDATVFGHLAPFVYTPTPDGILTEHVKETYANLGQFIERVKEKYWPDWEETCSTMNMNTHHKKE